MNGAAKERVRLVGGPLNGRTTEVPADWTDFPLHDVGSTTGGSPRNNAEVTVTTGRYRRSEHDRLRFEWEGGNG